MDQPRSLATFFNFSITDMYLHPLRHRLYSHLLRASVFGFRLFERRPVVAFGGLLVAGPDILWLPPPSSPKGACAASPRSAGSTTGAEGLGAPPSVGHVLNVPCRTRTNMSAMPSTLHDNDLMRR